MLLNIIDLEKIKVEDIMVPHHELVSVDINNEDEIFEQLKRVQHTRLLIFDGLRKQYYWNHSYERYC